MSTDATPSWSGYIFQGEVALCKAIETIISLGDTIPDDFCLTLEQDEDFSIKTSGLEVFQVKAYTMHNYQKYIKAWNDMMTRFDTNIDHNYLYLQKENVDLTKFDTAIQQDKLTSNVISGVYTLENITSKIDTEIGNLLPETNPLSNDIKLKRNYCLNNMVNLIKLRHRTKIARSIPLLEIKNWILSSDLAYNEDIFWLTVVQKFLKNLSKSISLYDMSNPNDIDSCIKVTECYENIDCLDFDSIKKLVKERINAHVALNDNDIRNNSIDYMNTDSIDNIITTAIEDIVQRPDFENLVYNHNKEKYQLSLISCNISDPPRNRELIKIQGYLNNIHENNLTDVDYIITDQLTLDKNDVAALRRNITDVPDNFSDSSINITDPNKNFAFKKLSDTITDLNP